MSLRSIAAAAILLAGLSGPARAQRFDAEPELHAPGWVVTPSAAAGLAFDDNPVLASRGDTTPNDTVANVSPGLRLTYRARHTHLGLGYNGSIVRYRTLDEFDSFDQGARAELQHQASRRLGFSVSNTYTKSPSTDVVELAGVPFVRTGTQQNTLVGATTYQASRTWHVGGTVRHQWLEFDRPEEERAALLEGGHMYGLTGQVARAINRRVKVGGSYSWRRAMVGQEREMFHIQDIEGTIAAALSPTLSLEGSAGLAYLSLPGDLGSRRGPAGRIGLHKQTAYASYGVSFMHSFVPAFGFGGSLRNSDLSGHVRVPLSRRLQLQTHVSWRRSTPVLEHELGLSAVWLHTAVGYAVHRWLRIQGYYAGAFQDTPVAGGRVDRNRVGVQIVTFRPVRVP